MLALTPSGTAMGTQDKQVKNVVKEIDAERDASALWRLRRNERSGWLVRTAEEMVEACHRAASVDLWMKEFDELQAAVNRWCGERRASVSSCFVPLRGRGIKFYVAIRGERFDFDLADAMAEFCSEAPSKFGVGLIEMYQVPASELQRFVDPEVDMKVYGNDEAP